MSEIELTILMPCLNEERTIGFCIDEAKRFVEKSGIPAEILISDNGSTDSSAQIAKKLGARIVHVPETGYGVALRSGIYAAAGKYVIMGDCDKSYDLYNLSSFLDKFRSGFDLVVGNRFTGNIEKGSMPLSHRLGVPALSLLARLFCKARIGDFHCGLRGVNRASFLNLSCTASGMEFATEMIIKAAKAKQRITEIPINLRCDGRNGAPHLRTLHDGARHIKCIFENIF